MQLFQRHKAHKASFCALVKQPLQAIAKEDPDDRPLLLHMDGAPFDVWATLSKHRSFFLYFHLFNETKAIMYRKGWPDGRQLRLYTS